MVKKSVVAFFATVLMASSVFAGPGKSRSGKPSFKNRFFNSIKIDEDRLLVLKGDVREGAIRPLVTDLVGFDKEEKKKIFLVINTNGGSIEAGMELVNAIRSSKSEVICIIESKAYSMGAIIATFCTRTYMHKWAELMFHEASYGAKGTESIVPVRVKAAQDYLKVIHTDVAKQLGMTHDQYKEKIRNEWWMTARQAFNEGIVYGVVDKLTYPYEEPKRDVPFFLFDFEDNPVDLDIELEK